MIPDSVRKYVYYEEPDIVLLHGDCLEILPLLEPNSVDLVLTDPPYGIDYKSGHATDDLWIAGKTIKGDASTLVRDKSLEIIKPHAAFVFGSRRANIPVETRMTLIWDKGPALGMGALDLPWKPSYEEIYVIGKGFVGKRDEGAVIYCPPIQSMAKNGRVHPTQKPLKLLYKLLKKSPPGTVLDPFLGSGTTAVACKQLGRKCIGIEIEAKYLDIAIERLRQEVLF